MDKRIAGIIMFLPCIDWAWNRSRWGDWLWEEVQRHRFHRPRAQPKSVKFWPLSDGEAAGTGGSVLSGDYVRDWSVVAQKMAVQGGNSSFTGRLTLSSFWSDFNCNPSEFFDRIAPTPLLWIMATDDVVCGPLEFTKGLYDNLEGPKQTCVLDGEHLPQYFDPGFPTSVEAMLSFLKKY
jgi:uncharacterized protein